MREQYVGEILVRQGALTAEQLKEALGVAEDKGARLQDVLMATEVIDEHSYLKAMATELGLPVMTKIQAEDIPPALVEMVPINFARQHHLLPVAESDGELQVAVADALDLTPLDDLRVLCGRECKPIVAPLEAIDDAINRVYERKDENALAEAGDREEKEELQDLIDMTDEAPVIRWVNNLFYESVRDRASDIHIEPGEREVTVRYRIDGTLYKVKSANLAFLPSIVSRVKIEAGLNIAEKRLPQDGRITKKIKGKLVDVRVSTIPTARGERIVLRLLDKAQAMLDLHALGMSDAMRSRMEGLVVRPNGIILVTGPTGAGKTTTLYACLNKINSPELNILTVEDPVEYELAGISQMNIQPKIGLTFASGLRSFLRQDPDIIMVGEIRDEETAEIAIHASLTGHLVLSTLHTNDAAGAIARLVEMDMQPFLISSSLLCVLAQRLVRRLCPACKEAYIPSDQDLRSLDLDPRMYGPPPAPTDGGPLSPPSEEIAKKEDRESLRPDPSSGSLPPRPVFCRPVGCDQCVHSGYRGRSGIYELLVVDEPIRREILNNADSKTITRVAAQRGMLTLREDGARQVLAGRTSLEEVLAMTAAGEDLE